MSFTKKLSWKHSCLNLSHASKFLKENCTPTFATWENGISHIWMQICVQFIQNTSVSKDYEIQCEQKFWKLKTICLEAKVDPMLWRNSLRSSHPCNLNLIKCFKSTIVVGSDSMDLQPYKSNFDNKYMFPMVWGSFLRFSHPCNLNLIKCFKSTIVLSNDSMDLQSKKILIMKRCYKWFKEAPWNFHILSRLFGSNVSSRQLLLVMIEWSCNRISLILIMRKCFQWFEEVPWDFHIFPSLMKSNASSRQLLLVVIQCTCNRISPMLIMRRCFQWFEEAPWDFHILPSLMKSNASSRQLFLVMIEWNCNKISPMLIMRRCLQWFEEAPWDFHIFPSLMKSNASSRQLL